MNAKQETIRVMRMQPAQTQLARIHANVKMDIQETVMNVCLYVNHHALMVASVSLQMYAIVVADMMVVLVRKISMNVRLIFMDVPVHLFA